MSRDKMADGEIEMNDELLKQIEDTVLLVHGVQA